MFENKVWQKSLSRIWFFS